MTSTTADPTGAHACVDANWLSAQRSCRMTHACAGVQVSCVCVYLLAVITDHRGSACRVSVKCVLTHDMP
jgi:hypothetical protein